MAHSFFSTNAEKTSVQSGVRLHKDVESGGVETHPTKLLIQGSFSKSSHWVTRPFFSDSLMLKPMRHAAAPSI
jgi:hypothetical protein